MKLQLKFHDATDQQDMDAILSKAKSSGVTRIHQYSPKHPVLALRRMYCLEVANDRDEGRVFKMLKRQSAVEYVEREVERKLVAPLPARAARRALNVSKSS